jgi:hypothetical protein
MRCGTRSVAVVLLGAAALFALIEVTKAAQFGTFENPNPALFARLWPLWSAATAIVPGISVALLAIRRAPLLSAAAYSAGGMANHIYHYGEWDSPRTHFTDALFHSNFHFWLDVLEGIFLLAAIGIVVALATVWLKRRLTIGSSDRGAHLR